jgi:hypothetical protein
MPQPPTATCRWLLLVHQLPPRPSKLRVHVWRRLQQVGAVALRNSLYVLPNTAEAREDFEWLRTEILDRGGQVSVFAAGSVDGYTDEELEESFKQARAAEYDTLMTDIDSLSFKTTSRARRKKTDWSRDIARLRERLFDAKRRDFFGSPRAAAAQTLIERLEQSLREQRVAAVPFTTLDPRAYRRRVWLTRPRPGIDRVASAWLIRRFIAPDAKFVFGSPTDITNQIAFDMPNVEFGHHGDDCTYETLIRRFGISDAAAIRVGHIVHDLDLKESRYGLADTATIGRLVDGLRHSTSDDAKLLAGGMTLIEALHQSFASDKEPAQLARTAGRTRKPKARRLAS